MITAPDFVRIVVGGVEYPVDAYPPFNAGSNPYLIAIGGTITGADVFPVFSYDTYGMEGWEYDYSNERWRFPYASNSPGNKIVVYAVQDAPGVISPFNTIFRLDSDELEELAEAMPRVYRRGVGQESQTTVENNSEFIIALTQMPFNIKDYVNVSAEKAAIKIGDTTTGVSADQILEDKVTVDLGEIEVGDLHGNSYDYDQVKYQLTLPFLSFTLDLRPEYVVNCTVSAQLVIDMYKGDFTVNVWSKTVGTPVQERLVDFRTERLGRSIPIHLFKQVEKELANPASPDNGVMKMSLRCLRNGVTYSRVSVVDRLGDVRGFLRVEDDAVVELGGISNGEKVLTRLREGVIINPH